MLAAGVSSRVSFFQVSSAPRSRGCPFQNAVVELADPTHPGNWLKRCLCPRTNSVLRVLVEEAVGKAAAKVAPAVNILVEGAIVTAVIQGNPSAADVAPVQVKGDHGQLSTR